MNYTCFTLDIKNHIAHIVLNRPEKRNSMIAEFWDELPAAVSKIDNESLARVIVISSTGPHFSSGMDISTFQGGADTSDPKAHRTQGEAFYQSVKHTQKTFSMLEACRLPIIAAIQGGAIGGGVDLATACDIRYATREAFTVVPAQAGTHRPDCHKL